MVKKEGNGTKMKNIKKILAGVTACLSLATLTACSSDLTWSAKSGETEYAPGIYLYQLIDGYNLAYYYELESGEERENPFDQQIDGVVLEDYVKNYANDTVKEYFVLEQEYIAAGLEFTEDDQAALDAQVEYYWDTLGENFENAGVSELSFEFCTKMGNFKSELMENYKEEQGVSDEFTAETETKVLAENTLVNAFVVYTTNVDGTEKDDAEKAELKTKAEDYVQKIIDGTDIVELYDEYQLELSADYVPTEEELATEGRLTMIVSDQTTIFDETQVDTIFNVMEIGDVQIIEMDYGYAIIEKLDFEADETRFEETVASQMDITRTEEYQAYLDGKKAELSVDFNESLVDAYTAKSVVADYEG